VGSRRANTSNTHRRSAVPSRSAADSIVSSYWSVNSAALVVTPDSLGRFAGGALCVGSDM
jgi:hypothetical protein